MNICLLLLLALTSTVHCWNAPIAFESKDFHRNQVRTEDNKPQALMDGYYYEGPHTTDTDSAGNTDAAGQDGVQGFHDDEQEETPPVTLNVTTTLPLTCEHVRLLARKPPAAGRYVVYRPEHYSSGDHGFQMVTHSVYCDFEDVKVDAMSKRLNGLQLENADDRVSDGERVVKYILPTDEPAGGLSYARDCTDVFMYYLSGDRTSHSGIYKVYNPKWYSLGPTGMTLLPINVYCDMRTSGGGWTMFQRRQDGSEDFYRSYHDYEHGFGEVDGEHWLGLRFIHMITALRPSVLQIHMVQRSDNTASYARYGGFKVADDSENYKLTVGCYSGNDTRGDRLGTNRHNGSYFSTYDRDQDTLSTTNCAYTYKTGFWLGSCLSCNLNGLYNVISGYSGICWGGSASQYIKKYVTMSFRPEFYQ